MEAGDVPRSNVVDASVAAKMTRRSPIQTFKARSPVSWRPITGCRCWTLKLVFLCGAPFSPTIFDLHESLGTSLVTAAVRD
jgi:hypothetical protein